MSHSTVLIIGEDYNAMLAPYDENREVEPYWELEAATPADCWWVNDEHPADTWEQALAQYRAQYRDDAGDLDDYRVKGGQLERRTTYNPDSRWDWYTVGGRWSGRLRLRPGHHGEEGEGKSEEWNHYAVPAGYCDSAYKRDLDLEAMRTEAVIKAEADWKVFEALIATHGPLPDDGWRKGDPASPEVKAARAAYWDAPRDRSPAQQ